MVVDEPRYVETLDLDLQGATVHLDEGLAFEVRDKESGTRVGWAYVGDGTMSWSFHEPGEALAFAATRAHADPKTDLDVLRAAVSEQTWTESIDRLLVLGELDSVRDVVDQWPVVRRQAGAIVWKSETGEETVVITDLRPNTAHSQAKRALTNRVNRMSNTGIDPRIMLAQERVREGRPRLIVEARTEPDWVAFLEPAFRAGSDRWVSWIDDNSGAVDDRYQRVLAVQGIGVNEAPRWRVLTGVPHAEALGRVRISEGTANVILKPKGTGRSAAVEVEALLQLTSDADSEILDLSIPKRPIVSQMRVKHIQDGFELVSIETVKGQPVEELGRVWGPYAPSDRAWARSWRLPEPVGPNRPLSVVVRFRHEWPLSTWYESVVDRETVFQELGRATTAQPVMPVVPGDVRSYNVDLRVGTGLPKRFKVGIGAGWTEPLGDEDGRWVSNEATSLTRISVGAFELEQNAPALGFPRVRILLHNVHATSSPSTVRGIMNFYQSVLPPYPHKEVAIVQAPDRYVEPEYVPLMRSYVCRTEDEEGLVMPKVRGYAGHIELQGLSFVNAVLGLQQCAAQMNTKYPKAVERGLAQALAADWWRDRPWPRRDAWLPQALAAMYRNRFVDEAYRKKVRDAWRRVVDGELNKVPDKFMVPLAHTKAEWAVELGARLLGDALRKRIGEPALLRALDRFHQSGAADLGSLQKEIEASAHVSLDDFFGPWFVAGVRPRVEGTWRIKEGHEKKDVEVALTSDLQFGTFAVPVEVLGRGGARMHWVRIQDGAVTARLPSQGTPKEVTIDPHGWLPLKSIRLRAADDVAVR